MKNKYVLTYYKSYHAESSSIVDTAQTFNEFLSKIDNKILKEYEWEVHKVKSTIHSSVYTETKGIDKVTK